MPKLVIKKTEPESDASFLANTLRIAHLAADKKAVDIKAYDVRGLTLMADSFLLCTATSEPQMKAVYNAVREGMKEVGVAPLHTEGTYHDGWLLMDFSTVILHVFRQQAREFYDLDGMWADAPEIELDVVES